MSDAPLLSVKPVIKYPREAQVGKTYLMTIDLQPEEGFEWQYEEEEYPIYCTVDSDLFSSKPIGEPVVVLHRFGGSYGASKFLLTAVLEENHGRIQITLVNRWGVTTEVINLEPVEVVNERVEDSANPIFTFSNSGTGEQKTFLIKLTKEKKLSYRETEVFFALFGERRTRSEIAASLCVKESTVKTYLTGVYRKFGISGSGSGKESRLKDELRRREELWKSHQAAYTNDNDRPSTPSPFNESLFERVRQRCRQKILSQHSRMRLLSGEEIGVDQLYVDVWLLNRSPRTFQVSQSKLLQTFDLRNDRLGLGNRIQRDAGFKVANANTKLLILGKPGAGKTTFLKHLAVDWCKGMFQPDLIAVLIELRRIRNQQWQLLDAIREELGLETPQQIEALLHQSKLLVLMDGLDEVPTNELRRNIQSQLRQIAEKYANNRWILTSRTQIIEAISHGFTSVEVADFSPEQVQRFVQNWFKASGHSDAVALQQWERFDNAVSRNSALRELMVTPVLLSLMCLVFQDEGEIPARMTWLYQKGIKLLLSRWNEDKQIDGWEVGSAIYQELSVAQKEALLSEIAARKFENPENRVLFEQEEIAAQIAQFLRLANPRECVAVLKAMEAQHGLLIERANELWSFSHLVFQEYFTVQWLTQLSTEQLAERISDQHWQEIVKQLVKSQQPADRLIRLIKYAIDRLIENEPVVNKFLAQRTEQLRQQIIMKNQDITYDLHLIDSQIQLFQRYYNANKFLVDLMNIEGTVSDNIRVELEDTLLLPWNELQRHQPDVYG